MIDSSKGIPDKTIPSLNSVKTKARLLTVMFILLILLPACSLLEPAKVGEIGKVAETVDTVKVMNVAGLLWWQWIIIGMFIPSPLDIIAATVRFFKPL